MLIKKPSDIRYSEVTPKSLYMNRRKFLLAAAAAAGAAALAARPMADWLDAETACARPIAKLGPSGEEPLFHDRKDDAFQGRHQLQQLLRIRHRQVRAGATGREIQDHARGPSASKAKWPSRRSSTIDRLMKLAPLEERIYRHRCVEGWSIVVPWIGFSLSTLINQVQPTSQGEVRRVLSAISTRSRCPGSSDGGLDWPYVEGLRMDEAMHPLTMLCVGHVRRGAAEPERRAGAHGRSVEVRLQEHQGDGQDHASSKSSRPPPGTRPTPHEYGFYSNVNPERGSSALEPGHRAAPGRVLAERKTLMFNGYDQVASLYTGMDLRKYY